MRLEAGGRGNVVRYTAKKTKRSAGAVKKAVKKVGSSRKRVERRLGPGCDSLSPRRVSAVPLGPFSVSKDAW
jgi:uncharacterized protein DUF3606